MNERLNAIVGAKISEFKRKMADVKKTIRTIPKNTVTNVKVVTKGAEKRINLFQDRLARLANSIRAIGTVMSNMGQGGMLIASPALVPIIASLVGLIGTLGPMIAVAGSNMVALGASFGIAGGAALAFGFAAAPTIQSIIDGTAEATEENSRAIKSLDRLKSAWKGVQKAIAPEVAKSFALVMEGVQKALISLEPMFTSVANVVTKLSGEFNKFMGSSTAQEFFGYLNKNAAPILDKIMSGIGGLVSGFMNLTVAFAPLTNYMAQAFEDMGISFASFTERVKNSKGLQDFISYVQTNGPKIWAIVKNIVNGLIGMFTAFAPLAADMMTGLQNLTAKFAAWGQTLSDNQQFQQFIGYIRENAPTVLALIGNITTFLVNLGIAMAPLGAKILGMVNAIFAWSSSMLAAHPIIGQIFGGLLIGVGIFQMIIPLILAVTSLFSGFGTMLASVFTKIMPLFNTFKLLFITGLKMMAKSLGTFILKVVKHVGVFILNVAKMGVRFLGVVTQMIASALVWSTRLIMYITKVVAKYAWMALKAGVHAAKVALSFTVTMVKAAAKATASMIASMAKLTAKYAWMGAKSLAHAAKVAASWLIAMGPVGWVIAAVAGVAAAVIANWDKIKNWTSKAWNAVWGTIKDVGSKIKGFFDGLNLYKSGKAIIQSAIDGIMNMKDKIVGKVEDIVGKVRDLWPFSPAKEGPLSDIHRMDFAGPIGMSIDKAKSPIMRSMQNLAGAARNAFTPDIALADIGASVNIGTNLKPNVPVEYDSKATQEDVIKASATDTSRMELLLERIVNSNQTIVLDSGALVGETYNEYDRVGGNKTVLTERWGR